MQRSKQQALMFLLGAVLVGGVLGFSARSMLRDGKEHSWAARQTMYDDLELTPAQRAAMDSVIDEKNRRVDSILKPVKLVLDSVRNNTRTQFFRIFTPEQRTQFENRVREDSVRREQVRRTREHADSLRRSETQRTLEQTKK